MLFDLYFILIRGKNQSDLFKLSLYTETDKTFFMIKFMMVVILMN